MFMEHRSQKEKSIFSFDKKDHLRQIKQEITIENIN